MTNHNYIYLINLINFLNRKTLFQYMNVLLLCKMKYYVKNSNFALTVVNNYNYNKLYYKTITEHLLKGLNIINHWISFKTAEVFSFTYFRLKLY